MIKNIIIFFTFLLFSCSTPGISVPDDVMLVINASGNNKKELLKVIKHYSESKDSLKLKAAYFLIKHSIHHFSYHGDPLDKFNIVFDKIANFEKIQPLQGNIHFPIINKWQDSIMAIHGVPHPNNLSKVYDHKIITYEMIVENIEYSFKAWSLPWSTHLTFENFCEFILPYRFENEKLESWRSIYFEENKWLIDSMKGSSDPVKACELINKSLKEWFRFNEGFSIYPTSLSAKDLIRVKMGRCIDQAAIANFAMRSMGIPIIHEKIPQWGDRSLGHDFSAVLTKSGSFSSFLGGELNPGENEIRNKPPKIFRQFFSEKNPDLGNYNDLISNYVGTRFGLDVTNQYIKTSNVSILKKDIINYKKNGTVVLSVFNNNNWVPISISEETDNSFVFENMGRDIIYLPCVLENRSLTPIHNPLYIDREGETHIISNSNSSESIKLFRKYPLSEIKKWWMTLMGKGKIEASNSMNFAKSDTLYTIPDSISLEFHRIKVSSVKAYKYVRYLFPENGFGSLGELSFYSEKDSLPLKGEIIYSGKIKPTDAIIAFDGKIDKFIHTDRKGDYNSEWVGLEFKKSLPIKYIGFSPRNDLNNVIEGNLYELLYWDNSWISLEFRKAKNNYLIFNNTPKGALFLLRNHSAGKEERIFLYNGEQVWF